jgi:hypothetical protein
MIQFGSCRQMSTIFGTKRSKESLSLSSTEDGASFTDSLGVHRKSHFDVVDRVPSLQFLGSKNDHSSNHHDLKALTIYLR